LIAIFLLPFFKKKFYNKVLETLHALAASTLFSDALLHLLPEVIGLREENESDFINVPDYMIKICVSIFCLYLFWLIDIVYVDSLGWIIILGDAIHNLTDGLAVGASFSQSLTMGLSTSIAVVFHEIPRN